MQTDHVIYSQNDHYSLNNKHFQKKLLKLSNIKKLQRQ